MSCKMANIHHGVSLTIKFHKVWFLDVCFFYLYKRSNWKYSIKPKTSYRWHLPFFMIINDPNATAKQLCENLDKTQEGASQRKLTSNWPPNWPPPGDFSKIASSKQRVKPCCFVTFDIMIRHIFSENFIENPQAVQKFWRILCLH